MIHLNTELKIPLYQQLYEQLKSKIISGEYGKGVRLTSTRELAKDLCLGRNTVESTYDQLCIEGYIGSRPGSGFIVLDLEDELLEFPCMGSDKEELPHNLSDAQFSAKKAEQNCKYRFRYGDIDPSLFPHDQWRKLTSEVLTSRSHEDLYNYGNNQGELELRQQLASYLQRARGVRCVPDQVILGGGFQDLMGIICQLLQDDKDTLAMEEPGYDFTRVIFEHRGYRIVPVKVGDHGIVPDVLDQSGATLTYVTPSHQLPLGRVMPIQQRMKLLQWANQVNGLIIEDDYDSELRYKSRPIPSLQSIDCHERVIYVGTFSKSFAPGLRMGYMVLPSWLLPRYSEAFSRYKCVIPRILQYVAADFMASGKWEKHLRKICLANKKKHDVLIQLIQAEMGDKVCIHGENAGLHIMLEFVNGEDQDMMIEKAAAHQVLVYPANQFWYEQENAVRNLVMIGFGGLSEDEIIEGINLLRQAWFD